LIIGALILGALPIQAISSNPTTLQINSINAFQNVLVLGDMAFATDFSVIYAAVPTENITTTYNVRLMNSSGVELSSIAPFSYYANGFARGVVWMYFDPTQVTALGLTWNGTYTMRLDGNPTASWSGSVPSAPARSDFTWNTQATVAQTSIIATNYILVEAQSLTTAWNSSSYILYTTTAQNGTKLTTTGEAYFANIIPNVKLIAPNAFLTTSLPLELRTNPATPNKYAQSIAQDFQGVTYTSTTDTVDLTNGSATVVGTGTNFVIGYKWGQIKGNADGIWYTIIDVPDTTHLTLQVPYGAAGGTGLGYTLIYPVSVPSNPTGAPANPLSLDAVSDYLAIPKAVFGTVVWLVLVIFVMIKGAQHANSYKPLIILVVPLLYVGARLGFYPLGLLIGLSILSVAAVTWTLFFEKTSY